jgi:predicted phage terminase large subunit-like protein
MVAALDEYDLIRSITRESFYEFVIEFWDEITPDPYEDAWYIRYLCDEIQVEVEFVLARKSKRYDYIIINIPPGCTKSTILMRMLNAWVWAKDPSRNFIGASYERGLAVELAGDTRLLVKSEKYQRCFPKVIIRSDMDAKGTFGTTKGGKRYSTGTTGNVTGKHGDIVVVDDPLNPRAARSEALTLSANRFVRETLPSRKRNKKISPTFLIMQRLAEDDPTGMLLEMAEGSEGKLKIKHICLPDKAKNDVQPPELRELYVDGLLDPERLPLDVLEKERLNGEFYYAGQFEQRPIPAGGAMFKTEMLKTGIAPPNPAQPKFWTKQVRYTDKAGTYEDGCYTVGVRMGKDKDGRFWVLHVDRYRQESAAREARMKQVANIDGKHVVQAIEQEPGSGGKDSARASAKNLAGFHVVLDRPTGDKIYRADPYAGQVNGGNVYLAPEGILDGLPQKWHMAYLNELQFFPHGKFRDQGDASSGGFKHLTTTIIKPRAGRRRRKWR